MINYRNNSDTAIIVLHEIYGLNQHIRDFCRELSQEGFDVIALDLLGYEQVFDEEQEEAAYQYFINQIGFESAARQVKEFAKEKRSSYRIIILIGFSIGATMAWLCSQEAGLCDAVVGFYGSRIRDYLKLQPDCPVLLFYPENEKAFVVRDLINILNEKEGVQATKLQGEHGFDNPASIHYNEQAAQQSWQEMIGFIRSFNIIEKQPRQKSFT